MFRPNTVIAEKVLWKLNALGMCFPKIFSAAYSGETMSRVQKSWVGEKMTRTPSICTTIEQTNRPRLRLKQTSERVCTDGRVPDKMRERVSDRGSGN